MKRGVKILIVVLVLIIIGLAGFIVWDKVINKKDNNQNNPAVNESVSDVAEVNGLYKFNYEFDDNNSIDYSIYFYNDGYYRYSHCGFPEEDREVGTYSISNNNIVLNQLYTVKGDMFNKSNKEVTLIINSDGTISDKNSYYSYNSYVNAGAKVNDKYKKFDFSNIVMKKASPSESEEFEKNNTSPKADYMGEWNNDDVGSRLTIYSDGTFIADNYTASSTIYGDYKLNGNQFEFTCKKNDSTYNKKWNGQVSIDHNGNYTIKVNLYDKDTTLKKVQPGDMSYTQNTATVLSKEEASSLGKTMYEKAESCYEKASEIHSAAIYKTEGTNETEVKIDDLSGMEHIKSILIGDAYKDLVEYYSITEKNGEYYIPNGGMGSNPTYIKARLPEVTSIENDKIEYTVTAEYDNLDFTGIETKSYNFVIKKVNGEWKVEEFTLPY